MDFGFFIQRLKAQLQEPLPGEEAQYRMAPDLRAGLKELVSSIKNPKRSAVLVCVYPKNEIAHTVLIVRPDEQGVHSGQVSFPGGKFDEGDDDLIITALREAEEEIGIKRKDIEIIGALTPLLIPASEFHVQPYVGVMREIPVFSLNKDEVSSVIEMEWTFLLDEKIKRHDEFRSGMGFMIGAPYYEIANQKVWGATAMMLSEMEEILKRIG